MNHKTSTMKCTMCSQLNTNSVFKKNCKCRIKMVILEPRWKNKTTKGNNK